MYASFAHASGHTHCERFARDIGRFVAVVKVYWLARVARSAAAAPVGGGAGPCFPRTHDRVADFSELHGGPGGWGLGLGRYAQSTRGRDGRQTAERSQVRGFRRLRAWALASCDAGKPGLPAVRVRPQRERKPRSAARLQRARPPALATCAAWKALAWPLLEPAERLGCALWYLGYSGYSISDRG